ncbi:hypothetical protein LEP1GSC133_3598 [Leptospira borgpetersenii serovar Pomona str. 200901868]|uniref:Uncharacterized protein n=1 Tax=Leptospira borgpetersenii serovar Pomona str. 200901868 TaxID=1192866 RepID=M6WFJ9_LEPBO|nr:hypothetical protein LEP1GSC133_3598 [Leptospira borgpetersenii serovar Pomona str. 200901868]
MLSEAFISQQLFRILIHPVALLLDFSVAHLGFILVTFWLFNVSSAQEIPDSFFVGSWNLNFVNLF